MSADEEIAQAQRTRLAMLDAVHLGIQRRTEVLALISNSESTADALAGVQKLLGVAEEHARAVLDLQFGRLTRSNVEGIGREREQLRTEWA